MISHVVNAKEGMEMTKQTKTKIGVGFVVKAKVGELENITREERIRRMRKEGGGGGGGGVYRFWLGRRISSSYLKMGRRKIYVLV